MEKSRKERLKLSFMGDEDIAYIESLEKQIEVLKRNNALLEREKKALADEAEMKCELNYELQKQVDNLAKTLANLSDYFNCERACPIGNPLACDSECFDENVWKEWAMKDDR